MHSAHASYLETQILSSTPQRLRLLLIEGAMRFAAQAELAWREERIEQGAELVARCRAVVAELLAAIKPEGTEVTRNTAAIYLFIFRLLIEAQVEKDAAKLADVVRILEEERLTWQQLCEAMPEAPEAEATSFHEVTAGNTGAIKPNFPAGALGGLSSPAGASSFSFDA